MRSLLKPASLLRRLRTYRNLPSSARRDLRRAQAALLRAQLTVLIRRRGTLLRVEREKTQPADVAASPDRLQRARELVLAVDRASRYGLVPASCLVRAIAGRAMLDRDGIHGAVVRVGVRLRHGRFHAHAWVEYAGENLDGGHASQDDAWQAVDLSVARDQ